MFSLSHEKPDSMYFLGGHVICNFAIKTETPSQPTGSHHLILKINYRVM